MIPKNREALIIGHDSLRIHGDKSGQVADASIRNFSLWIASDEERVSLP